MSYFVVDTNVLIVANGKSHQASGNCALRCGQKLEEIKQNHVLILDDGWLIIGEYSNKLSSTGQPGLGDKFLKWVFENHTNPQRCEKVKIIPTMEGSFAEFPDDESLSKFDSSDRKFAAVALTHPEKPPILNAVDSDWKDFETAFKDIGITIIFLCPDYQFL